MIRAPAPPPNDGTAAAARNPQSFLAFDYGRRHVGTATGNSLTRSARPLRTISLEGDARFAAIGALVTEWQPAGLVVGIPFHPDGAAHENTHRARRFARQLQGRFGLPVHEVDERYSTTQALSERSGDVDAASAAIILDQFLNALPQPKHDQEPSNAD